MHEETLALFQVDPYTDWYNSFVHAGIEVIEAVVGFSLSYNLICT
jgi:hypothetical protein